MQFGNFLIDQNTGRQYRLNGCIPSERLPNNPRLQQRFSSRRGVTAVQLPNEFDLRPDMTPVENQSTLGSCVANAFAGAYEYILKKDTGIDIEVSRLFIYYNARVKYDGSENNITDSGCSLTSAIEALYEFGTCLEAVWPYDTDAVNTRPNEEAYEQAQDHQITSALQLEIDLNEMKTCLAQGYPFAFCVSLFESFSDAAKSGVVPKPGPEDTAQGSIGSHAMLAVGYSDAQQAFIVRNSWGTDWGQEGYCYMSYDYLTDPDYVSELRTVRRLETDDMGYENSGNEDNRRNTNNNTFNNYPDEPNYNPQPDQNEYDNNPGFDQSGYGNDLGFDQSGYGNDLGFDQSGYSNDPGFDQSGYGNDPGFNQFDGGNNFSYNQYGDGNNSSFNQFENTDNFTYNQFGRSDENFN